MLHQHLVQWHILNIGCLSRNRFWGEDESQPHRHAICTSTLIDTGEKIILVDPSLRPEEMALVLDSRYGITHNDVDMVFITHFHGDHYVGLENFKKAAWYMGSYELERVQAHMSQWDNKLLENIAPLEENLTPGIQLLHLPGHTSGLTGLLFHAVEGLVVITSDAVMTRDFFRARQGYFNSENAMDTVQSIEKIAKLADVVIPGHDNYFNVKAIETLGLPVIRKKQ